MIRYANKFDLQDIIRLLKEFAEQSELANRFDPLKWSKTQIEAQLAAIFAGAGFILIDEKKTGLLVAVKSQPLWVPNSIQLQEAMLYAKSKITMSRLTLEYIKIAKQMLVENKVQHAIMYATNNTDYSKYGLKHFESIWEI